MKYNLKQWIIKNENNFLFFEGSKRNSFMNHLGGGGRVGW